MKRSEVIGHINGTLTLTVGDSVFLSKDENRLWLSELILQRLEEAGMVPSLIEVLVTREVNVTDGYGKYVGPGSFTRLEKVNQWEEE